jgi:hypothetical protein
MVDTVERIGTWLSSLVLKSKVVTWWIMEDGHESEVLTIPWLKLGQKPTFLPNCVRMAIPFTSSISPSEPGLRALPAHITAH